MKEEEAEVQRLLGVLRTLMRMLGFSNREVERRLGLHPSSLTRFFNGQVEAKMETVLGIVRSIGLNYGEFFSFAYPVSADDEGSEAAQRVGALVEGLKPARSRPATKTTQPALDQLIEQLLKRLKAEG